MLLSELAQATYSSVLEGLRTIPAVESVTLLGEPLPKRKFARINDLDTLIICSEITPKNYAAISDVFENERNRSSPAVAVIYDIADGPYKPAVETEYEIFNHVLLHTPRTYKRLGHHPFKITVQEYDPSIGKPVRAFDPMPAINLNTLLGEFRRRKKCLDAFEVVAGIWKAEGNTMHMQELPLVLEELEEKMDVTLYVILRGASNAVQYSYSAVQTKTDIQMCSKFENIQPANKIASLPRKALALKEKLRERELKPSASMVESYRDQAHEFLCKLEREAIRRG